MPRNFCPTFASEVTTSTPLRDSCSIKTLVSYLAYLLGLDHSRTRDPHAYGDSQLQRQGELLHSIHTFSYGEKVYCAYFMRETASSLGIRGGT